MKNKGYTRKIATTALFSAIAAILMMLNFPVPFMPPYIKFDFSELPALLISFAYGPLWGMLVCLIKNIVNFPFSTASYVGVLSNFILGTLLVVPAGIIYKIRRTRSFAILGLICGTLAMGVVSIFTNYYIIFPFYQTMMPLNEIITSFSEINPAVSDLWDAIILFNFPFNLIKGAACSVITFIVYKKLSPVINGKRL